MEPELDLSQHFSVQYTVLDVLLPDANGYITKPVLPSVLLEAIQTVVAG